MKLSIDCKTTDLTLACKAAAKYLAAGNFVTEDCSTGYYFDGWSRSFSVWGDADHVCVREE